MRIPFFLRGARLILALALGSVLVATATQADDLRIAGTGAALGSMRQLAQAYARQQPQPRIQVLPSLGSSGGIMALLDGAVQIAVSSRMPSPPEAARGAVAFEYGVTPVVFATARGTPVKGLSLQELVEIYAGRRDLWPDGSRIRLLLRPVGEADSEAIKNLSPALREAKDAAERRPGMPFTVTDQETASQLEKLPGALGPSTLSLLLSEQRALKALALDGVQPDAQALAAGRYPLSRTLYLVTLRPPSPGVQGFVDFVRSPEGRRILERTGHWVR